MKGRKVKKSRASNNPDMDAPQGKTPRQVPGRDSRGRPGKCGPDRQARGLRACPGRREA